MSKIEFYIGDTAYWEVSNASGKSVLVPVKVIEKTNDFGGRYTIEPVGGQGRTVTENLVKIKND